MNQFTLPPINVPADRRVSILPRELNGVLVFASKVLPDHPFMALVTHSVSEWDDYRDDPVAVCDTIDAAYTWIQAHIAEYSGTLSITLIPHF